MRVIKGVSLVLLLLVWTCTASADVVDRSIVVNIPGFTLYLYENGVVVREYPISIGTELKPSVLGDTTIINKVVNPAYYGRGPEPIPPGPDNPVGTRWMGLGFPSYGIHGTNDPNSIGTAASAGCIRMYNEDVEELFSLVRVGTPVSLVYQTVVFGEDPIYGQPTVTIYPDVYSKRATRQELEEGLRRRGWYDKVFWPALEPMLAQPSSKPECLPLTVQMSFNGEMLPFHGAMVAGRCYIPYGSPDTDGFEKAALAHWGGQVYVDVEAYASRLGLLCEADGEGQVIRLQAPHAYLGDSLLGSALTVDGAVYLAAGSLEAVLDALAAASGRQGQDDEGWLVPRPLTLMYLLGEYYIPAQAVLPEDKLAELRVQAPPQDEKARPES